MIHPRTPLLRDRRDDILWFARQFLHEVSEQHGGDRRVLSPAAEQALVGYPWPGNLRELRHCIERACILSGETTLEQYIRDCERGYIQQALERFHGQIGNTAAYLGISRKNLWEKMKRLQIQARALGGEEG